MSTVRPHLPEKHRIDDAHLPAYEQGYYVALSMALRVMRLAEKSWEHYMEEKHSPRVVNITTRADAPGRAAIEDDDRVWRLAFKVSVGAVVLVLLELVVWFGIHIARAL